MSQLTAVLPLMAITAICTGFAVASALSEKPINAGVHAGLAVFALSALAFLR